MCSAVYGVEVARGGVWVFLGHVMEVGCVWCDASGVEMEKSPKAKII